MKKYKPATLIFILLILYVQIRYAQPVKSR